MNQSDKFELKLLKMSGELASAFVEAHGGNSIELLPEKTSSIYYRLREIILNGNNLAKSKDLITLELYCISSKNVINCYKQENVMPDSELSLIDKITPLYEKLRGLFDNKPKGSVEFKQVQ